MTKLCVFGIWLFLCGATFLGLFADARRKWDKVDPEVSLFFPGAHYIMLTFNDDSVTDNDLYVNHMNKILDELSRRKARATFFLQGSRAAKNAQLFKRIGSEHHEIANLGWETEFYTSEQADARKGKLVTPDGTPVDEELLHLVRQSASALEAASGKAPQIFRPPFRAASSSRGGVVATSWYEGEKHAELVRSTAGHQVVLWSLEAASYGDDKATATAREIAAVKDSVLQKAKKGDVVLMHVTAATAAAIGSIVDELQGQGFETITLSEMLSFPDDKPHRR